MAQLRLTPHCIVFSETTLCKLLPVSAVKSVTLINSVSWCFPFLNLIFVSNCFHNQSSYPTINVSINQPINQSVNQSSNPICCQSINRSINHFIHQSINQSICQSINQSFHSWINESIRLSINQSFNQFIHHSIHRTIYQSIHFSINHLITFSYRAFFLFRALEGKKSLHKSPWYGSLMCLAYEKTEKKPFSIRIIKCCRSWWLSRVCSRGK